MAAVPGRRRKPRTCGALFPLLTAGQGLSSRRRGGRRRSRVRAEYSSMNEFVIEQAVYGSEGAGGYHFLARSSGFRDDWLPEAERLCTAFGERPAGVACP